MATSLSEQASFLHWVLSFFPEPPAQLVWLPASAQGRRIKKQLVLGIAELWTVPLRLADGFSNLLRYKLAVFTSE